MRRSGGRGRRQLGAGGGSGGPLASLTSKLALHLESDYGVTQVGGKVSEWAGREGWRNTVVQATDANRPTLVDSVLDGKPAVRFAGSHWLQSLAQVGVVASDYPVMYVVCSFQGSSAGHVASYDNGGTTFRGFTLERTSGSGPRWHTYRAATNGFLLGSSTAGGSSVPALFRGTNTSALMTLDINGIENTNVSVGAGGLQFSPDGIWVGRKLDATAPFTGDIFNIVVLTNPTADMHTFVMNYLATKYPSLGLGTLKPLGTKLVLDLDADKGVTEVSGKVTAWNDQSTYANHCTQATGAAQPTRAANVQDGHAALQFSGAQWLLRSAGFAGLPIGCVPRIYCVACYDDPFPGVSGEMVSIDDGTLAYRCRIFNNSGHYYTVTNPPAAVGVGSLSISPGYGGVLAIIDARDDLTVTRISVNEVAGTTATASPGAMNGALARIAVGATATGGAPFKGKIVRLVIVNNPSATEHQYVLDYLAAQYPSVLAPQLPPLPTTAIEYWHSELGLSPTGWTGQLKGISLTGVNAPTVGTDPGYFKERVVAKSEASGARGWANTSAGTILAIGTKPWKYTIARVRSGSGVITDVGLGGNDSAFRLGVVGPNFTSYVAGYGYLTGGAANQQPHKFKEWIDGATRYLNIDGAQVSQAYPSNYPFNGNAASSGMFAVAPGGTSDSSVAFYLLCSAKPTDAEIAALDGWAQRYWGV